MRSPILWFACVVSLLVASLARVTPATARAAEAPSSGTAGRSACWVFLRDKGVTEAAQPAALATARAMLTGRAIERRVKARGNDQAVDGLDLPVHADYVRDVLATGATHRTTSRWLNAISIEATPAEVAAIRALPFVSSVREVARGRRAPLPDVEPAAAAALRGAPPSPGSPASLDYGECATQLVPIQVPLLHDLGLSGAGVRIALLDTGFEHATHVAVQGVNVIAEHDFIFDDDVTSNEEVDYAAQHYHGSWVLSLIAGYAPGHLIGPAYGAEYLLAKTEDIRSETPVEEDFWIEAAEWADSLGADIISTSLQYIDWYTYADIDGDTAPITIAADLAAMNGIAVFASAGNSGGDPFYFIGTPADGDSVIAVGAVDEYGYPAYFTSHGPTYDGRTKPDIAAMGALTLVALVGTTSDYGRGSGTSFSCPIAAGVGALLLEQHPAWTPMDLGGALRSTASRASNPDQTIGWGIIRGFDASQVVTSVHPPVIGAPGIAFTVSPNPSPGPFTLRVAPRSGTSFPADASLTIVSVGGRVVRELWAGEAGGEAIALTWDARDARGERVPQGVYYARLLEAGRETTRPVVVIR